MATSFVVLLASLLVAGIGAPVSAQEPAPATAGTGPAAPAEAQTKQPPFAATGARMMALFDKPLHPVIGSVATGWGVAAGVGYDSPSRGPWQLSTKAMGNTKGWLAELNTGYRGTRAQLDTYVRMRDLTRIQFFGLGADSDRESVTNFRLREPVVGAIGSVRVHPWVDVGGRVEQLWPEVGGGRSQGSPSLDARFGEAEAPGLSAQPRFGRYQAFLEINSPAALSGGLHQGGKYRVSFDRFNDQELDRFTFDRVEVEAQHRLGLFGRHRRLTLHGWVSTTHTGENNDVPFFLQPALGGTGNLRGPHDALIGSDGTEATLRGFRHFRFRDRHLLLLQTEYRWTVWGPLDATVFAEAGKVTNQRSDLDLSDLKRDYGFSLSLMRGIGTAIRMDVGLGGGEGAHVFLTGDFLGWKKPATPRGVAVPRSTNE